MSGNDRGRSSQDSATYGDGKRKSADELDQRGLGTKLDLALV